ncbi:MAG: glycoside hydrolase family 78 protein [Verrucomicrobiae bacterium]|nr:glycoside hydrolase family 78 protein [Verrucomicrobiae bacterium]
MTWLGQWIWTDGETTPRNAYAHFRRRLNLTHVPSRVIARLTADSRYIFWINGQLVCRGPARCDPRWQSYDELDIARHLRVGENALAALVHHYGESTFSYILGRAGFLFECSALNVWSDDQWRARPSDAWFRDLSRMRAQLDYPEVFDARREMAGWTEPGFHDAGWSPAVVIGKPPCDPWPNLERREIPFLRETEIGGARVIASGETESLDPVEVIDLQKFFRTGHTMAGHQVGYARTFVQCAEPQTVRLELITAQALKLWVNDEPVVPALIHGRQAVKLSLRAGWNKLLLKLLQGSHHWKAAVRFLGGAHRLPRAAEPSADPDPASATGAHEWTVSGPYRPSKPLDIGATLEEVFPPERNAGPETHSWQRLADAAGPDDRFGGGSERAVALLMEFAEHRPGLRLEGDLPVTLAPRQFALLDFGREVVGYPRLRVQAPAGAILDIGYGERLHDGVLKPNYQETACADRLITRAGEQTWEPFEKRAFRYLQVDCRKAAEPVVIQRVALNFSTYPVEARGSFECNDPLLDRIWQVGAYTVQLNMEDAYTDCPWRERAMSWADARVEFLVNAVAFGDTALMRRCLRLLAQSQAEDGSLCGVYPTTFPNRKLPSFTLLWIHALWDYYWLTGDADLVRELYPKMQLVLKWFARYVSPSKLLAGTPGWVFIDWARLDQRGEQAALNALYCRALELAGSFSEIVNARELAIRYRAQAREVKAAFHRQFWNPERQAYVDCRVGDEKSAVISQQSNALAVLFDIAPSLLQPSVLEAVCGDDPSRDPEGIVPCGSPCFSFYLLGALHRVGWHAFALDYIRTRWRWMLDAGATTWWEEWSPDASWCHGWSAGPTYLLTTQILGARPTAAGWREFEVRPQPCGLEWARGTIPTPQGDITIEWQVEQGRCKPAVRAPVGVKYRILPS